MSPSAPAPALSLRGAVYRHGEILALAGVDLELAQGALVALIGPNGAGKSTLVSLAAGLLAPAAGQIRVCGRDPRADRRARRLVGLAAQEVGLYPSLTVRQNLRAMGELYGMRAREARRRADALLAPFDLEALADRQVGTLSGGERRRAHAAAALVHRPRVALLDEPTAGVDPPTRAAVLDAVRALTGEGIAVVYTTHYLQEVERLGADVVLLEAGRVVAAGPQADLVARHGMASLLLSFDGPAPAWLTARAGADPGASRVRLATRDPAGELRSVLGRLGQDSSRLADVELVSAELEGAYLALTGRRGAGDGSDQ